MIEIQGGRITPTGSSRGVMASIRIGQCVIEGSRECCTRGIPTLFDVRLEDIKRLANPRYFTQCIDGITRYAFRARSYTVLALIALCSGSSKNA